MGGLSGLSLVRNDMHIDRNAALTNLDALSSIRVLGDMSVTENVVLVSLDGLAALESVSGYCSVSKNAALCQNSVVGRRPVNASVVSPMSV